jgi:short-subunit dehydrogenase
MPKFMTLSAEAVAEAGYDGFKRGRRVVVPGFANRLASRFVGLAPRRLLLKAMLRLQRRRAPLGRRPARPPAS